MTMTQTTGKGRMRSGQSRTHRSYQVAILEVLLDGQDHHRDELKMAGMRSCDPIDALGAFQRANPEQEKQLALMSGHERMDEALRQQVEGSRMLVSKALSHLVDRGMMEVASTDSEGKRETYRVTQKGEEYVADPPDQVPKALEKTARPSRIESREVANCHFCGEELFKDDPSTWQFGSAWMKRSATSGGFNSARIVGESLRWAHSSCLNDGIEKEREKVELTPYIIINAVCHRFDVDPDEMMANHTRHYTYLWPRHFSIYMIRSLLGITYKGMESLFSMRHTSLAACVRKMEEHIHVGERVEIGLSKVLMSDVVKEIREELAIGTVLPGSTD